MFDWERSDASVGATVMGHYYSVSGITKVTGDMADLSGMALTVRHLLYSNRKKNMHIAKSTSTNIPYS